MDHLRRRFQCDGRYGRLGVAERLGLGYVKSKSNFVLVRAGDRTEALVKGAFAKGIYLRDRSTEPGCAGSLRVATGIVEHTQRAIAVMEEVLCATP